eukprot:m.152488 g.152488  ORF g.152488 m.152488 type:complete len:115 (-) comp23394_c0_seq2:345-689(-)
MISPLFTAMLTAIAEADGTPTDRCSEVKSLDGIIESGQVFNRITSTFCNPWLPSSGTCSEQIVKANGAVKTNPLSIDPNSVLKNPGSGICTPQELRRLRLFAIWAILVNGRTMP